MKVAFVKGNALFTGPRHMCMKFTHAMTKGKNIADPPDNAAKYSLLVMCVLTINASQHAQQMQSVCTSDTITQLLSLTRLLKPQESVQTHAAILSQV